MGRRRGAGRYITTISITPELWELAGKHNVGFSEAVRVGLGVILAEKGEKEYDSNLNLYRKMNQYRQMAEEALQKLNEIDTKIINDSIKKEGESNQQESNTTN